MTILNLLLAYIHVRLPANTGNCVDVNGQKNFHMRFQLCLACGEIGGLKAKRRLIESKIHSLILLFFPPSMFFFYTIILPDGQEWDLRVNLFFLSTVILQKGENMPYKYGQCL